MYILAVIQLNILAILLLLNNSITKSNHNISFNLMWQTSASPSGFFLIKASVTPRHISNLSGSSALINPKVYKKHSIVYFVKLVYEE